MPHVCATLRGSQSLLRGTAEIQSVVYVAVALTVRIALFAVIGYLNGLGLSGRGWGWRETFVSLFIIVAAYAIAFKMWPTKLAWLVSGIACVVVQNIVLIEFELKHGFDLQRRGIDTLEWFVVGSIAGLVAMLVQDRNKEGAKPKPKSPYY